MVAVRILKAVGAAGFAWRRGQVVDLPPAQAAKWADGIRGEYAETTTAPRETTVRPAPETPEQPRPPTETAPPPERTTRTPPVKKAAPRKAQRRGHR